MMHFLLFTMSVKNSMDGGVSKSKELLFPPEVIISVHCQGKFLHRIMGTTGLRLGQGVSNWDVMTPQPGKPW